MVLAAVAALAISPAPAACEPPHDAEVLKESGKVVVWQRGKRVRACARRTGRTRSLLTLDGGLRIVRIFLPGERVILAVAADGFSEMVLYRFGSDEPVFLSAGFGDVTEELDRNRRGRFAWVETTPGKAECPCSVIAADAHQRFVVARRHRRPTRLSIGSAAVAFQSHEGYEQIHVPFVTPHRIAVRPDPGGPHSKFELAVTLRHGLPGGGRIRAQIDDQTSTGDDCNGMTQHAPRVRVESEGRERRITLTTRDARWCIGSYGGAATYEWRRHARYCSLAHPNCTGFVTFGRFRLRVRSQTNVLRRFTRFS